MFCTSMQHMILYKNKIYSMYQTVFLRSKRIWISFLFYTTMGIFHRTSREEYHTLFISSVYGAFSPKDTSQRHTWTHYGNKSTEWNYCFPQNFIRAWPRMCSTFGYTMFFPSGNRIGWQSESRACTKYGIKLHRRTVAKRRGVWALIKPWIKFVASEGDG